MAPPPPNVDVIIVGGGIAGISLAAWLAPRLRVLVVEQGPQPGAEATAQNAGMVRTLGEDPAERALALRTATHLAAPPAAFPGLEGASRVTGAVLAMAHDPWHLHEGVAALRARGERVEACDRPWELAPALAGARLAQAWHQPEARVADAWLVLQAALRGARQQGAELRCNSPARTVLTKSDRAVGVVLDDGAVHAPVVVNAAGAWAGPLGQTAGVTRPLVPVRRTLLQSAPDARSQPSQPWAWVDDVGAYVRPESGGWLVSGCDETPEAAPVGPGSRGPVHPAHRALAEHKLARFFPPLAGTRWATGWTGLRTFAPDRAPLLGEDPDCPGLWWLAGLGGFGVSCGLAAAEAVAAWIQGEQTSWLRPEEVSPGRPHLRRWAVRFNGDIARARLVEVGH
jgi:D-arginine dehydrogenase